MKLLCHFREWTKTCSLTIENIIIWRTLWDIRTYCHGLDLSIYNMFLSLDYDSQTKFLLSWQLLCVLASNWNYCICYHRKNKRQAITQYECDLRSSSTTASNCSQYLNWQNHKTFNKRLYAGRPIKPNYFSQSRPFHLK